ncbi:hypothetical protein NDU88_003160 [Pleurodeles waltl]|uniref:Uncharacterized protein n=1 Tax=Pleurodeles waltl TaxID=8319 RepID=A0AAV7QEX5_PLEWA|nr:hypothetical protein NDU88_003160 [Pleurodeles waltl]
MDYSSMSKFALEKVDEGSCPTCPSAVGPMRTEAIATETTEITEMNCQDGKDKGLHAKVAQSPTIQKDHKTGLKPKVLNTKKSYIHNYFVRARSGVGKPNNLVANETTRMMLLTRPSNPTLDTPHSLPECARVTISSSLYASAISELQDLADTADTTGRESNNFLNNLGSLPSSNACPAGHDFGPEETKTASSASTCHHLVKRQADPVKNNKWHIMAEIHQPEDLLKENAYVHESLGSSRSSSTPQQGTKERPLASFLTPELDAWVSQEPSMEMSGSSNETRGRLEVSTGRKTS